MTSSIILIVGPSGVGKDSIIDGIKDWNTQQNAIKINFPQRHITRPESPETENFVSVGVRDFRTTDYLFSWGAHELMYGIPKDAQKALDAGEHLLFNASRSVILKAEKVSDHVLVLNITTDTDTLRQRLMARGRETADAVEQRLARDVSIEASHAKVVEIDNSGDLEVAVSQALSVVKAYCESL